jgi:hypothetical protein
MSAVPATPEGVIAALAKQWAPALASHLVDLWRSQFADSSGPVRHEGTGVEFHSSFLGIRLRGMAEVPCLMIGGEPLAAGRLVAEFARRADAQEQLCFLLTVSDELAAVAARQILGGQRCVVFTPAKVATLLNARDTHQALKAMVVAAVPSRALVPYNYLLTPDPNMFFGRGEHLDKLIGDADMSFAVVGPGKIGKTSLVSEYRRRLVRSRDPRAQATFFVDMHECGRRDSDSLAQFLARKIEGTSRSQSVSTADFFNMLRRVRLQLGGRRPELLLDEADEICHHDFLQKTLGEATKLKLCRLILCGRGQLLRVTQSPDGQLGGRLAPMRLDPLDSKPAEAFLIDPLTDLGFQILDREEFVHRAFALTGRLPHLLQVFGKRVAELGIASGTGTLDSKAFDTLRWDYELAQMMVGPLDRLDDLSRLVAVALLKNPPARVTHSTLQHFASKEGLHLGHDDVREVANELFIHNVLAWSNGAYRIAYEALPYYAREMGLLELNSERVVLTVPGQE